MKKLLYILFALILGFGMKAGAKDSGSKVYWICSGTGYDVAYTVRGDMICSGSGYDVAYTVRGDMICSGTGYDVVYTIR